MPAADYEKPAELISKYLRSPTEPIVILNPQRDRMLVYRAERHPPVARRATPVMRLAGLVFNPANLGQARVHQCLELTLKRLNDDQETVVALPRDGEISLPFWSPDGAYFALLNFGRRDVQVMVGDAARGRLRRYPKVRLNATMNNPIQWLPDGRTLLCELAVATTNRAPGELIQSIGPTVRDTAAGRRNPGAAPDLLSGERDEQLLENYCRSQLALLNVENGEVTPIGEPGLFSRLLPSPDGQYVMVVKIVRPYSREHPIKAFPREVQIWSRDGVIVSHLASLPLAVDPSGGVPPFPRSFHWRPTEPADLVWVEPLDAGDARVLIPYRDRVMHFPAPFNERATELFRTEHRLTGLNWGEDRGVSLVREQIPGGTQRTLLVDPDMSETAPRLVWEQTPGEGAVDPGSPMTRTLPNGQSVMRVHQNCLYLIGKGISMDGERPFLDRLNLSTFQTERLFQSDYFVHESVVALIEPDASRFITRRSTATQPPNYFIRTFPETALTPVTTFGGEFPELQRIHKQLITFERYDGVPLSFTVHLPPDYEPGKPLPTIVWVYPQPSANDATAHLRGAARRFTDFSSSIHLFLALKGYAVLDNVAMPVIRDPRRADDGFLEQVIASARAVVDKAVEMGIADPARVGVGGHSFGAFTAVNLLAHTDIFRAGVARSGAYNRTLTPFGFQNERRTLWEVPELYAKSSPLFYANRINEPILFIHGEKDTNPATAPVQSEQIYEAVKGNGGTARLVILPYESHQYSAVESLEHVVWEMGRWFDLHLKRLPPSEVPLGVELVAP